MAMMSVTLLFFLAAAGNASGQQQSIAQLIKREVAEEIAGINARDAVKATAYETFDTISMESGRPPSIGREAYIQGLSMAFKHEPAWHLTLVDEAVDVARSADIAVYRSTYDQDSMIDGVPATQKANYIALFRRQPDHSWKIAWSVVSNIERPHKK